MDAEYTREPCPYRIIDDCGGAFAMGAIGGSIFHAIKGFRNAPTGWRRRLLGSTQMIRQRAGVSAGSFAMWGGLFAVSECSLKAIRKKEDPWNPILSGFLTGGAVMVRQGPMNMLGSAVVGGILLGLIEGCGILFNRMTADQFRMDPTAQAPGPPQPLPTSSEDMSDGGSHSSTSFG